MKNHGIAALALLALAGTAMADVHETQTFAGPFGTYGPRTNALNTTLTATFTGVDGGTSYTPSGMLLVVDLESVNPETYDSEVRFFVTPPSGPTFVLTPSLNGATYTTITDATVDVPIPAGVNPIGTWTLTIYESYYDSADAGTEDSHVSNVRFSLQNLPPVEPPANTDLGTLTSTDISNSDSSFNGVDVKWYKITLPADANATTGYYVDITTDGTQIGAGESGTANDTVVAVYDAAGLLFAAADDYDYPTDPWTSLSFGAGEEVARSHSGYVDGFDGDLTTGNYYIAAGAYFIDFGDTGFNAQSESTSSGGTLVVNVFSNFPGTGPTACSPADVGVAGGTAGQDRLLNNNDFISFITLFFNQNAAADLGVAGGTPGHDSAWDNNDFIAFINYFFNDQASCTG
jgi:hypothetical protein